ncbi:MAG: hypothetical protein EBZ36_17630, partial [Acidobacteria bacterium]|nr:hypothetical protein [Acidobacteriota bacterium]
GQAALARPWIDLDDPRQQLRLSDSTDPAKIIAEGRDFNYHGIPWVVGAKKGLPNFQEGFWQTRLQLTRRLRVLKSNPLDALSRTNARPWDDGRFSTEAQYRFDVVNSMGMDAWNSYQTFSNRTAVTLIATNYYDFAILDENEGVGALPKIRNTGYRSASAVIAPGQWKPGQYLAPLNTGFATNFVYDHIRRVILNAYETNGGYVSALAPAPRLSVAFTNRLVYALVDQPTGRILDMVTLKSVLFETNVLRLFSYSAPGGAGISMSDFWATNRYSAGTTVTRGVGTQLEGSLGLVPLGQDLWRDASGAGPVNSQVEFEKDGLYYFLFRQARRPSFQVTPQVVARFGGRVAQAGYTPSPVLLLTDRRQANDPLVHYTADDPVSYTHL